MACLAYPVRLARGGRKTNDRYRFTPRPVLWAGGAPGVHRGLPPTSGPPDSGKDVTNTLGAWLGRGAAVGHTAAEGRTSSQVIWCWPGGRVPFPSVWSHGVGIYLSFEWTVHFCNGGILRESSSGWQPPPGVHRGCGRSGHVKSTLGTRHGCLPHPRWESHCCMTNSSPRDHRCPDFSLWVYTLGAMRQISGWSCLARHTNPKGPHQKMYG